MSWYYRGKAARFDAEVSTHDAAKRCINHLLE